MPKEPDLNQLRQEISGLKAESSKLVKKNDELQAIAATYTKLFNELPNPVAITRMIDGVFMEINDAWTEAFEYTRKDLLGKKVVDINLWQDYGEREVLVNHISLNGSVKYFPCSFVKKSGEIVRCLLTVRIIDFNRTKCLLSSVIVITLPELVK